MKQKSCLFLQKNTLSLLEKSLKKRLFGYIWRWPGWPHFDQSKRLKMSEPSGSTSKKVKIFDPDATEFEKLVKMEAFVDHTNVIKHIVGSPTRKFVAAPSRFCKSTNVESARSFLEIEVHKGGPNEGDAIRDVLREATSIEELKGTNLKNYDLFCVPEPKCKILEDEEFVLKHFGRYPVIKLDFAVARITSFNDAVDHCLYIIHKAYKAHKYLQESTRLHREYESLNKSSQDICREWCDDQKYMEGDDGTKLGNVKRGLTMLTKYLHSHFERKVVLLVDDFDAIVSSAKVGVKTDQEVRSISGLVIEMLGNNLKGDHAEKHMAYVLLTGIESIPYTSTSSRLNAIANYMFLDKEDFVGFYGVHENDARELITKLKSKGLLPLFKNKEVEQIMEEIMKHFNAYYSQGISIFCLCSVLHYLQDGKK